MIVTLSLDGAPVCGVLAVYSLLLIGLNRRSRGDAGGGSGMKLRDWAAAGIARRLAAATAIRMALAPANGGRGGHEVGAEELRTDQ
jgi:hypothetical protein